MNGNEPKYQKARDIASVTMCTNPYPNIDTPYCEYVCHCFQQFPPLSLSEK